jgi:hypothetical protein
MLSELSYDEQEVGMERFSFGDDVAFVPHGDLLDGVTVAPLTQPFEGGRSSKRRSFESSREVGSGGIPRPSRRSSSYSRDQGR